MRRAAIVSPIRTAVGKYLGALSDLQAGELGAVVLRALVERTGIDPGKIDDVIFAQGYGSGEAPCIARWSALAAGLPIEVPGYQLDRRCGSGISLGHPIGATGGRILANLLRELKRRDGKYGLETMCIGGGQGIAAVFERA